MRASLTWLLVADVDVKTQDDDVGEEGGPPVDDKHDHAAEDGAGQGNPHVVVLEAGTPTWSSKEQEVHQTQRGRAAQGMKAFLFSSWF